MVKRRKVTISIKEEREVAMKMLEDLTTEYEEKKITTEEMKSRFGGIYLSINTIDLRIMYASTEFKKGEK